MGSTQDDAQIRTALPFEIFTPDGHKLCGNRLLDALRCDKLSTLLSAPGSTAVYAFHSGSSASCTNSGFASAFAPLMRTMRLVLGWYA